MILLNTWNSRKSLGFGENTVQRILLSPVESLDDAQTAIQ